MLLYLMFKHSKKVIMNLIAAPSLFLVYQMSSIETGLEQGIAKVRNKSGSFFCFCFVKQKSVHCCT